MNRNDLAQIFNPYLSEQLEDILKEFIKGNENIIVKKSDILYVCSAYEDNVYCVFVKTKDDERIKISSFFTHRDALNELERIWIEINE